VVSFLFIDALNTKVNGVYVTQKDLDKDGTRELCLKVVGDSENQVYIITKDPNGTITKLARFEGLEIKLAEPVPVQQ